MNVNFTKSRRNHSIRTLALGFLLSCFLVASADSDLPSDAIKFYDEGANPDHRSFNNLVERFSNFDAYGTPIPDFARIDPALNGWVEFTYQNWVNAGSTAYEDGFRVVIDWKFDDIPYRDTYYIFQTPTTEFIRF